MATERPGMPRGKRNRHYRGDEAVEGNDAMEPGDDDIELLARAYHEQYRSSLEDHDPTSADRSWSELPEALKESNRASARAVAGHLDALGLSVQRVSPGDVVRRVDLDPDLVEAGARLEHARWCAQRRSQGYVHGDVRDDHARPPTHPDLIDWAELDEATREKDRMRIRAIPEMLATIGLEVTHPGAERG